MALALPSRSTVAEYLAFERSAEGRHELIDGEIVAMSGASRRHTTIAGNLLASVHAQLRARGRPCRPFGSDMRVGVADFGLYTYPDLSAVCGEPRFEDAAVDTLLNPVLLVEVLSPSTAAYDRGAKWERYRAIASLREYVLVDQDRAHVERYLRRDDGTWVFSELDDPGAVLRFESIGCEIALAELYEDAVELGDR
jgi:Uma2 family endonuclease